MSFVFTLLCEFEFHQFFNLTSNLTKLLFDPKKMRGQSCKENLKIPLIILLLINYSRKCAKSKEDVKLYDFIIIIEDVNLPHTFHQTKKTKNKKLTTH